MNPWEVVLNVLGWTVLAIILIVILIIIYGAIAAIIKGVQRGLAKKSETPRLSADEKAEVARFGIHDQGPGLPEVTHE